MARTDIFLSILFVHLSFRRLYEIVIIGWEPWPVLAAGIFLLASVAFATKRGVSWRRGLLLAGTAACFSELARQFPFGDNHGFVEAVCLALAAFCHGRDATEHALLERSLKFVLAFVFIHAGWQKVAHGVYFDGSYLLLMAGRHENFRTIVEAALGTGSARALAGLAPDGPFRVDSFTLLFLSNGIYVAEILTGVLLLVPRTRVAGLVMLCCTIFAIEWVAREFVFGLLCLNLAMLYAPRAWARRSLPAFAAAYLLLLFSASGLGWEIHFK